MKLTRIVFGVGVSVVLILFASGTSALLSGSIGAGSNRLASNTSFIAWNSFFGGDGDQQGGVATDGSENVYVTGSSKVTWGHPIRPFSGTSDAFVAKLDSTGILRWNTFLGGIDAYPYSPYPDPGYISYGYLEYGARLTTDGSGNVYVAGYSISNWGKPIRFAFGKISGAFWAKLNPDGALHWNAFIGGGTSDAADGIAVDGSGNAYIAGNSDATWGNPIHPYAGSHNTFVAKIAADSKGVYYPPRGGAHGHERIIK